MRCTTPISVRNSPFPVPCGKCYACLANNRAQWIFRLLCEFYAHKIALFVTLTYDEKHLPYSAKNNEETIFFSIDGRFTAPDIGGFVPSVNKRDVQLFIKRLRRKLEPENCRYFVTAEYGSKTFRPHYHMLVFFDTTDRKRYYDLITNLWTYGNVKFGDCEPASIAYCTKYCLKETKTPSGAANPFRLMSCKPALGDIGYQQYMQHVNDINFFRTSYKNYRASTPRLWRDKYLKTLAEDEKEVLQADRMQLVAEQSADRYERWQKIHPNLTFRDYVEYLWQAKQRKEEIIKKRLTKTVL